MDDWLLENPTDTPAPLGRDREAREKVEAALAVGIGFSGREDADALLMRIKETN